MFGDFPHKPESLITSLRDRIQVTQGLLPLRHIPAEAGASAAEFAGSFDNGLGLRVYFFHEPVFLLAFDPGGPASNIPDREIPNDLPAERRMVLSRDYRSLITRAAKYWL